MGVKWRVLTIASVWLTVTLAAHNGCSYSEVDVEEDLPVDVEIVEESSEPVILVDRTGKEWDVTTAVHKYGFKLKLFEYGLGPYAIRPVLDAEMLSRSMPGYPGDEDEFPVVGIAFNGDVRSYGIIDIVRNEVVDEYIGGVPLAVAY